MDKTFHDPLTQAGIRRSILDASNVGFPKERDKFVSLVRAKIEECILELHGPEGIFDKIHGHSVLRSAPLEDRVMLGRTLRHRGDNEHEHAEKDQVKRSSAAITGIFPCIARHLQQSLKIEA